MSRAPRPGTVPGRPVRILSTGEGAQIAIELEVDEITKAHELAFLDANLALDNLAKKEVKLRKWAWPIDPSPRDVVDRGQLGSSIQATPQDETGREWIHAVNVNYAAPVLLGYRVRTARGYRNMPARNIYREPLSKFAAIFGRAYARRARGNPGGGVET
jgi:hypothetical protein